MLKLKIERAGAVVPPPVSGSGPLIEVWRDNEGEICAYGETIGEDCWMHLPGLASFRFSNARDEVTAVVDDVADDSIHDAYHRRVLPMALQVRGREVLHASAVCAPAGVIAFCGVSESGKSTIAHAFDRRGRHVWADDVVGFEITKEGPVTMRLPFRIRLRRPSPDGFTIKAIQPNGANGDRQKSQRLAAVCILRKSDKLKTNVELEYLPPATTFAAILPHAYFFSFRDSARKRLMIQNYLELVARVPIYELRFRSGLENLDAMLDAIETISQNQS